MELGLRHTEDPTSQQGEDKQPHRGKPKPNAQITAEKASAVNTQERLPGGRQLGTKATDAYFIADKLHA